MKWSDIYIGRRAIDDCPYLGQVTLPHNDGNACYITPIVEDGCLADVRETKYYVISWNIRSSKVRYYDFGKNDIKNARQILDQYFPSPMSARMDSVLEQLINDGEEQDGIRLTAFSACTVGYLLPDGKKKRVSKRRIIDAADYILLHGSIVENQEQVAEELARLLEIPEPALVKLVWKALDE